MKSSKVRGIARPRGSFEKGYIHKLYGLYLQDRASRNEAVEDELILSYLEYHVSKSLFLFLLSGANDLRNLIRLLERVIEHLFRIAVFRDVEHCSEVNKISVDSRLDYKRLSIPLSNTTMLGGDGICNLGQNMILGSFSSDYIPQLDLKIELGYSHLLIIKENPGILQLLMMTMSRVIPIHIDYKIRFKVRKEDYFFRLGKQKEPEHNGALKQLSLGITSVLGAG